MRVLRRLTHGFVRLAAIATLLIAFSAGAADTHKVLRLANGDIATLDPHQWTDYFSGWVGAAIFEGLYEWDYLARPVRLVPNTADSLPRISDDGRTWTMRVKPGIYFTPDPAFNDKPRELTAQDFVYSFKRRLDPNLRPGGQGALIDALLGARAAFDAARKPGARFDYEAPIEGVRALDRYTIEFRLTQPNYPVMEQYLTDTYAVAREVVDAAGRDIDTRAVGTGPYRLKEWKRGALIVLEANPQYRELRFPESSEPADATLVREMRGKRLPQIGVVRINIIEEMQSRLLEFERGGLDYLELAGQSANRLLQNGKLKPEYAAVGVRHYVLPSSYVRYTIFNLADPVVGGLGKDHVALRRALALAFDSDALVNVAYAGQAQTTGQLVGPTSTTYDRLLPSKMAYDPAAARALLDRAGYARRDQENYRLQPDGTPLTLTILARPGTLWRDWETLWKKSLDAVGLRVRFRELPAQDQFKEMQAGQFQMGVLGWGGSPLGYRALQQLDSRQPPFTNMSRFGLKAYDELYDQMLREPDRQKQTVLSREMTKLAQIYMPLIPHIVEVDNDFVQPWVSGYRPIDIPSYWKYLDIDVAAQQRGISINSAAR